MKTLLESQNIRYVAVTEELVDDYLAMINDFAHVGRWIGSRTEPISAEKELSWVRRKRSENALLFSMVEKDGGAFIGNLELMDVQNGAAEMGIAITAGKQDRGYGKEAIARITEHAFRELGLDRIRLRVFPFNTRAIHVYEACGFREYDRTEQDVYMEIRSA